jgi:uncharacterized membrane protein
MKNRFLRILLAVIICGIISTLAEIFVFNFKTLNLNESDRSEHNVSYITEESDDKTILNLNIENKYIRQLVIDYSTTEDVDYTISYGYIGAYNQAIGNTFTDVFDSTFTISATNLDTTISQISIIFNNNSSVKINEIFIDNDFHFNYFRTFFIFLVLITICSIYFFYRDGFTTDRMHIYFAIVCSLLGLMVITAQPAMNFYCWDDQTHFDRVVNFPIGSRNYTHGEFNLSDSGTINHPWHKSTNSFTEHRIRSNYLDIKSTSDYTGNKNGSFLFINKIPYIPMAIGYHTTKFIGLPFTACFQSGKIINLLFYVLLMSYAIKILVAGKRLLTVIALLPTNVFLASEYSYDPVVLSGLTIFMVYIINLLLDKTKKFDFKTAVIMILSVSYACLAKAAYAPILLLILLVPKDRYKNVKKSTLIKIGFGLIALLLGCTLLLSSLDGVDPSDTRGGEVSAREQASLIVHHPLDYASILGDNAGSQFGYKLISPNTITNFSYAHTFTDGNNCYYVFLILLIFAFLTDNKGNRLNKKQRLSILGVSILLIMVIWSALYVNFTPVGSTAIGGVQNRYFLPLLLPILFSLQIPNIQSKITEKYYNLAILTITCATMIIMIYNYILVPYNF